MIVTVRLSFKSLVLPETWREICTVASNVTLTSQLGLVTVSVLEVRPVTVPVATARAPGDGVGAPGLGQTPPAPRPPPKPPVTLPPRAVGVWPVVFALRRSRRPFAAAGVAAPRRRRGRRRSPAGPAGRPPALASSKRRSSSSHPGSRRHASNGTYPGPRWPVARIHIPFSGPPHLHPASSPNRHACGTPKFEFRAPPTPLVKTPGAEYLRVHIIC